jgi:two-component system, chemotaxis family, chemotaxis protein CheY
MGKHIMVVDDSKTMRDMVAFTLTGAGYQVSQAEDGQAGLTVLSSLNVDGVITDLNMPKLDGIGLIKALRADPRFKTTPILMLTTESDPAKKTQGRDAGATGWIVKPFAPEKLVETLKKVGL